MADKTLLLLAFSLLSVPPCHPQVSKAASLYTNCACQCSSLTFLDIQGVVQGNCNTADYNGALWCYVSSSSSTCQDLVPSTRFPHNPWSYEACATPVQGSTECPTIPAHTYTPPHHHHPYHPYHTPIVTIVDDAVPNLVLNSPEQLEKCERIVINLPL